MFNYNPMDKNSNLNCNAIQLKIYYTGERFLYETNADVIVGFMPNNEYLLKHVDSNSYPVEVINVLQGYTNTAMCSVPMSDIIATNKQFIMIRDQERGMLEYLLAKDYGTHFVKTNQYYLFIPI